MSGVFMHLNPGTLPYWSRTGASYCPLYGGYCHQPLALQPQACMIGGGPMFRQHPSLPSISGEGEYRNKSESAVANTGQYIDLSADHPVPVDKAPSTANSRGQNLGIWPGSNLHQVPILNRKLFSKVPCTIAYSMKPQCI